VGWTADQLPDQSGRVAVVTGANSGIGWHTSRALAEHGARVVLAVRDVERGKLAAERIVAGVPSAEVEVGELNLASVESVRAFADQWSGSLDLLINNAGVMAPPKRATTQDGYELQFGTNHLGHFVLTGMLLPHLVEGARPRVVTVSSLAHRGGTEAVLDANTGRYEPQRAYSNSKLANLLFAIELDRQCRGHDLPVVSVAAHPGVSSTGLVGDPEGMGANRVVRAVGPVFVRTFMQSAAAGARAVLYAATDAEPGSYTGPSRLHETRGAIGPAGMSDLARDEQLAHRLWQFSEELTGFHYRWA
jgi:NAD(P)-dependent dehydrogenase (short-subunit alcohol dehydrogenase family)